MKPRHAIPLIALVAFVAGCQIDKLLFVRRNVWACKRYVTISIGGQSARTCAEYGWVPAVDTVAVPPGRLP